MLASKKTHDPMKVLSLQTKHYEGGQPKRESMIDPIYGLLKRFRPHHDKQELAFFTDTSICSGCKACEVACKQWNRIEENDIHWSGDSYDNTSNLSSHNWRHVKFIERFPEENNVNRPAPSGGIEALLKEPKVGQWLLMSDQCKHCLISPCHEACPTGAIMRTEYGGIYYQTDICMGCNMCVANCPFGVPQVDEKTGHSMKCSECYDRLQDGLTPACALACTTGAIQFGPREEMVVKARDRLATLHEEGHTEAMLYGVDPFEKYSALNSFYLLMDKPSVYGLPDEPVRPTTHQPNDYIRSAVALVLGCAAIIGTFFIL